MNITTSFGQQLEVAETPNGLSVSRKVITTEPVFGRREEIWVRDGKSHREDRPAEVFYSTVLEEYWRRDGELHRDDGSAYIVHREDGPAATRYNEDGSIDQEEWYRDGKQHRDDGPARIYYRDGEVFPGETRTFEELEKAGAVDSARWYLHDIRVRRNSRRLKRFT